MNQRPPQNNQRGGQGGQGQGSGGGQGQGGGGQGGGQGGGGDRQQRGGRNRFKRKRNNDNRRGGGGGGGGRGGQDNRFQNQNRNNRPQDDIHPLDPMRFIKVGKNAAEPNRPSGVTETFGVIFFDTVSQALAAKELVAQKASEVSHLNIIIKAETDRNIPELLAHGRVFAGEAWTIIHQRRVVDGWYNDAHEAFLS